MNGPIITQQSLERLLQGHLSLEHLSLSASVCILTTGIIAAKLVSYLQYRYKLGYEFIVLLTIALGCATMLFIETIANSIIVGTITGAVIGGMLGEKMSGPESDSTWMSFDTPVHGMYGTLITGTSVGGGHSDPKLEDGNSGSTTGRITGAITGGIISGALFGCPEARLIPVSVFVFTLSIVATHIFAPIVISIKRKVAGDVHLGTAWGADYWITKKAHKEMMKEE